MLCAGATPVVGFWLTTRGCCGLDVQAEVRLL